MDRNKKEILRKIREISKGELFAVDLRDAQQLHTEKILEILPKNKNEKWKLLTYFRDKEYLHSDGNRLFRITGKGIDLFDPWWIRHEGAIKGAIIGGLLGIFGSLLGVIVGYFLKTK